MLSQKLWTALVTPFLISGEVDYSCLRYLLARQEDDDVGVLLLGSTGENVLLEESERRAIVRCVSDHPLKVPIMVGVTATQLSAALNWISFCKDYPVSAFLISTPLYSRPGIKGQIGWFETLLNYADRPVMLYNIPQRTGLPIAKEVIDALSCHENFWGIKEADGHSNLICYYEEKGIKVFSGNDSDLVRMSEGRTAKGLVSVISNIWPSFVSYMLTAFSSGVPSDELKSVWQGICQPFANATNPISVKVLMQSLGLIKSGYVRPPLSLGDLPSIEPLLRANKLVRDFVGDTGSILQKGL